MNNISNLWGREPALILGLVQAGIVLFMAFGIQLSVEQVAAIMAFINIALAVLTRSQVVPSAKIENGVVNEDNVPHNDNVDK